MRYKVVKETNPVQYAVFDTHEGRVIVRYQKKKDADSLIMRYETLKGAKTDAK